MNGRTWTMYCRMFDGCASVGNMDTATGTLTVYVVSDKPSVMQRATDIGNAIKARLGVTVQVIKADAPIAALPCV